MKWLIQKKRNIWYYLYVESKKSDTNFFYKIEIDSQTSKINLWLPKGKRWGGINLKLEINRYRLSSVQFSCSVVVQLFVTPWVTACQASLSITDSAVQPNPSPLSRWCHPTISSSVIPFSSCPQSFPASGSFQVSQLFASGGQSIGVLASTSVLPVNTQDWSPLGWTGWISLQSKELSRVFSKTTVQKHQFFSAQLSL